MCIQGEWLNVFLGEAIVYVMRYQDSGEVFRMDESYEVNWDSEGVQ